MLSVVRYCTTAASRHSNQPTSDSQLSARGAHSGHARSVSPRPPQEKTRLCKALIYHGNVAMPCASLRGLSPAVRVRILKNVPQPHPQPHLSSAAVTPTPRARYSFVGGDWQIQEALTLACKDTIHALFFCVSYSWHAYCHPGVLFVSAGSYGTANQYLASAALRTNFRSPPPVPPIVSHDHNSHCSADDAVIHPHGRRADEAARDDRTVYVCGAVDAAVPSQRSAAAAALRAGAAAQLLFLLSCCDTGPAPLPCHALHRCAVHV